MNTFVTLLHIVLVVSYTVISFLADDIFISEVKNRSLQIATIWYFLAATLDIFVAGMMFFIFDDTTDTPDIIRDEERKLSYPVLDVIRQPADSLYSV